MLRSGSIYTFLILMLLVSHGSKVARTLAQEAVEIYDVLTCMEYDASNHVPNGVKDYFEYSDPSVTLWANMSKTGKANITVLWFSPEGSLAYRKAGSTEYESTSWQGVTSKLALDGFMSLLGEWSVELWVDDLPLANYTFHLIDKAAETWGLHAMILDLESPGKIDSNTNFTVQITVFYKFSNVTVITPGLWNPDDESLIVEDYDELDGEGTKTYTFTVQSPEEPGDYTIDAAVFYLYDDEWFIDEGGITSFQVTVESGSDLFSPSNAMVIVTVLATAVIVLILWKRR